MRFNVTSPDIELAYRLHKKYWNLGYATELAKALIEYGFDKLALPKIIAMVHPENERSKRVMEKAGMSYLGMVDYRESQWPCYVIFNSKEKYKNKNPTEDSQFELGVALLPSNEVQQEARRLNNLIANQLPEIENRDNVFHLSLFQGKFNCSDLGKLKMTLDEIATEITISNFLLEEELEDMGINIFWNAKNDSSLQALHESVVKIFSQYRGGMPGQFLKFYESLPLNKKQQLDLYGVLGVMNEFKPHITVFYRSDSNPKTQNILKLLKPEKSFLNFIPTQFVLGKLGYDGNIVEIVYQVSLK